MLKQLVEAALFACAEPITLEKLSQITGEEKQLIEAAIAELSSEYRARKSAIEIKKVGDESYLMHVKEEYSYAVSDLVKPAMSQPVLKTLSLIALKQPITQAEIVKSRGSSAYLHVRELIAKGFVSAKPKGRTKILMTTKKFSDYFGFSYEIEKIKREIASKLVLKNSSIPF